VPDIYIAKRVIDYLGLQARGVPEGTIPLKLELAPTLALLQAMGQDGAKLLSVDANGSLQVTMAGQTTGALTQVAGSQGVAFTQLGQGDAQAGAGAGLGVTAFLELWNGASYDRDRSASAANLAAQSGLGAALTVLPGNWSVASQPGAGVQASAVRAAGAAGVRHICTSIDFSAVAAVAPAATVLAVNLRDGASGAGTVLRTWIVFIGAAIGQSVPPFGLSGLSLVGSPATAMTLEFSALLANLQESVSFSGYDAA